MVHQYSAWKVLTRRKRLTADGSEGETKLNRVLGLWDLTALGVGSTLGAGVYVLAGQIAKEQAGPSVMISFAIAALASLLAGICYAEFGARVPKAGSAYVYSYVCIGEFVAFVIGWNLILEYVIGTASVCRGISLYLDTLLNDTLKETFAAVAPMNVSFMGSYFDFLAFGLVVVFGVALAFGVETSAMANNFVTCVNIFILGFVIIAGAVKADFSNWTVDAATTNATSVGNGGFFPFGFEGTLQGAATCFFGFVGFDCIATTGEEVRQPRKNIPRSILLSLLIIFLCYFGVSTVLTLMLPYYVQDVNAPLPYAFEYVGWPVAMWIVTIGGLVGLLASLFGALFPLPRVMYSMAQDGLLFRFLGKISPRYQVPVTGSIVAALFTALFAGLFDLAQLVSLLSIGTLLAYSVVAISITILRYMEYSESEEQTPQGISETSSLTSRSERFTWSSLCTQLFNVHRAPEPNQISTRIVGVLTTLFCLLSLGLGVLLMQGYSAISSGKAWALTLLILLLVLIAVVLLLTCLQPREPRSRLFRVPFVPVVPAISIFINIYLMLQLDSWTWIRFGVWMIVGIPIFIACWCLYDIKNLKKRNPERIDFYKALKVPKDADFVGVNSNGIHSKLSTMTNETQLVGNSSSLDQIQNLSEVYDDLREKKHANGKIFYVEDTKSEHSRTTLAANDAEACEDEHSVIAMLDDVLDAEDSQQQQLEQHQIFSRNFSIDSELLPSVIETTIFATVHNSSSDDDEVSSQRSLELYRLEDCRKAANEMLQEMFDSVAFYEQLQAARTRQSLVKEESSVKEETTESTSPQLRPQLKRVPSVVSTASQASFTSVVDDPLHSEKFKDRLSHLIMNPNAHKSKKSEEPANPAETTKEKPTRPQLKQSKSETDVRLLLLKAIRELKADSDDESVADGNGNDNGDKAATVTTSPRATNHIPRPPKFDPVLYKTINSISLHKQRPSLSRELNVDAKNMKVVAAAQHLVDSPTSEPEPSTKIATATTAIAEPEPETEPEPVLFKAKLEAILQRGPSHRLQQRPAAGTGTGTRTGTGTDVGMRRRPQSTYIEETAIE
ncbi:cationic amino acid transporter 3 isoform X1 [Drosophila innubila]|uniref:cationic amino acid transporter 3 isoform X1 n=1 Tax=Drosophila innubila TaxID=198719 RepID=UPI00148B67A7|nr:cationic amino acid transporter 3 isoform X1 [Drosophila innubila]XP_034482068.1 cationic amino acid transporter 3 isoform X1 [Drosophila innubila]